MSQSISDLQEAISASQSMLAEQEALRAELIAAKVKVGRAEQAGESYGVSNTHAVLSAAPTYLAASPLMKSVTSVAAPPQPRRPA